MQRSQFLRSIAPVLLICLVFGAVFALLPMPGGDDWGMYQGAAQRIATGMSLYGSPVMETRDYYSNPPWLAALFIPLSYLPLRWGWGVLAGLTLLAATGLISRYARGKLKLVLFLLSPPVIYTLIHGQVDVLILAGALLPAQWWPLVALTKPQVALGLALGVPRRQWLHAAILFSVVVLASLLLFGAWPLELLAQPRPFQFMTHNLWLGLWPFQVPLGIALLAMGLERKDTRFFFSASPFLFPYAAISSLAGPWLAGLSFLKDWQAVLVFVSWWAAVLYRALVGA